MSIGMGCRMISLKKFSPRRILLSQSERSFGLRSFHQNSVRSATSEFKLASPCSSS